MKREVRGVRESSGHPSARPLGRRWRVHRSVSCGKELGISLDVPFLCLCGHELHRSSLVRRADVRERGEQIRVRPHIISRHLSIGKNGKKDINRVISNCPSIGRIGRRFAAVRGCSSCAHKPRPPARSDKFQSRCITSKDKVAPFGLFVAGEAAFHKRRVPRFAVREVTEPPAAGCGVLC